MNCLQPDSARALAQLRRGAVATGNARQESLLWKIIPIAISAIGLAVSMLSFRQSNIAFELARQTKIDIEHRSVFYSEAEIVKAPCQTLLRATEEGWWVTEFAVVVAIENAGAKMVSLGEVREIGELVDVETLDSRIDVKVQYDFWDQNTFQRLVQNISSTSQRAEARLYEKALQGVPLSIEVGEIQHIVLKIREEAFIRLTPLQASRVLPSANWEAKLTLIFGAGADKLEYDISIPLLTPEISPQIVPLGQYEACPGPSL